MLESKSLAALIYAFITKLFNDLIKHRQLNMLTTFISMLKKLYLGKKKNYFAARKG